MQQPVASGSYLGPPTQVSINPFREILTGRCGFSAIYQAGILLALAADVVLAILVGLDAVDRGTNAPWLQFSYSAGLAAAYTFLMVAALALYRRELIGSFEYRWVLATFLAAIISWAQFGLFASWTARFGGESGVDFSEGDAFVTWIAANAVALVMFLLRFFAFAVGAGLLYTYIRTLEVSSMAAAAGGSQYKLHEYLYQMDLERRGAHAPPTAGQFLGPVQAAAAAVAQQTQLPQQQVAGYIGPPAWQGTVLSARKVGGLSGGLDRGARLANSSIIISNSNAAGGSSSSSRPRRHH